jgi:hypothetical protein
MGPMVVVEEYRFLDSLADLFDISEVTIKVKFRFYYAIDPFRHRVLVRVTRGGHTDLNAIAFQQPDILPAAVLYPPIRMMDQSCFRMTAILQRHAQRLQRTFRLQGGMNRVPHASNRSFVYACGGVLPVNHDREVI